MAHVMGKDCKLYRNSATEASPSWVLIENVIDLNLPMTIGEADLSTRESNIELTGDALMSISASFGMLYDQEDASFVVLLDAFFARTAIQFAVMDQAIATSGAEGFKAFCNIFSNDLGQGLREGMKASLTIKPTRYYESGSLVLPTWHTVA